MMTVEQISALFWGDGAPLRRDFGVSALLTDEQLAEIERDRLAMECDLDDWDDWDDW
jgi:hypothetical protein